MNNGDNNMKKVIGIIAVICLVAVAIFCLVFFHKPESPILHRSKQILPIFENYMSQRGWQGQTNDAVPAVQHDRHFELMDQVDSIELVTPYREKIPTKWLYNSSGLGFARESWVNYKENILGKNVTLKYNYSDAYLLSDNKKVDSKLAQFSMTASAIAYYRQKAVELMKDCGYSCKAYWNNGKPGDVHHVSFLVGHKVINNKTVIAVWVRGTSSNFEWESNFEIGKGGTHRGFELAQKEMAEIIEKYIKDNNIEGRLKFWITGHSRGAAVANLYAKWLKRYYNSSNIYAYTYATPRVSTRGTSKGYMYIHNFLNVNDFVTELAPAKWGYKRYGEDIKLPHNVKTDKLLSQIDSRLLNGFTKEENDELIDAFLDYAGNGVLDYYEESGFMFTKFLSPADVLKNIVSVATSKKSNITKAKEAVPRLVFSADTDSVRVLVKLAKDMNKLRRTHCPTTYAVLMQSVE